MRCLICREHPAEAGVLCTDCQMELPAPANIAPEQVIGTPARMGTVLVDRWGRPHALRIKSTVGRSHDGLEIAILDGRISRHHAEFKSAPEGWMVRDLGSANGTFLNEEAIGNEHLPLRRGDRLSFGPFGFYFIEHADSLPTVALDEAATATLRSPDGPRSADDFAKEGDTDAGLPEVSIRLDEPSGGGGGVLELDGKQLQLTIAQFEFISLLVDRMRNERHQPALVRGYVRTSELIGALSWDSRDPSDNHLKQLVRRIRRGMIKADLGDLIESRHRFGYRLRVIPR